MIGQHTFTLNTTLQSFDFELGGTATFVNCGVRDRHDVEIELNGSVDFDAERHLDGVAGTASGSQTHSGSINYVTSHGKQGTCAIDLSTSFTASASSASRTVEGSVCGNAVDVTTTWVRS